MKLPYRIATGMAALGAVVGGMILYYRKKYYFPKSKAERKKTL